MKQKLIKMQVKYEGGKRLLYFKNGGEIANTLTTHCGDNTCDVSSINAMLVINDETDTKYSEHSLVDKET